LVRGRRSRARKHASLVRATEDRDRGERRQLGVGGQGKRGAVEASGRAVGRQRKLAETEFIGGKHIVQPTAQDGARRPADGIRRIPPSGDRRLKHGIVGQIQHEVGVDGDVREGGADALDADSDGGARQVVELVLKKVVNTLGVTKAVEGGRTKRSEEEEAEEEEEEDEEEQPTLVENTVKPDNKQTPSKAPEDKKSVLASILEGSPKAI